MWELLTQIGFGKLEDSSNLINHIRSKLEYGDYRLPILKLGEAKYYSFAGKMLDAYKVFEEATCEILLQKHVYSEDLFCELQALIIFVKGGIYSKLDMIASLHLDNILGRQLTLIPELQIAFDYALALWKLKSGFCKPTDVTNIASKLLKNGSFTLAALAYREVGLFFSEINDYSEAMDCFEKSLGIANDTGQETTVENTMNAIGYVQYNQGHLEEAKETLTRILIGHREKYITPFIYENLALIEENKKNYSAAVNHVKKALELSLRLDHVTVLPSEALYLGETYEKHFNDLDRAETYYRLGYEHSLRYAAAGISLIGDRKKVVEAYVDFLKRVDPAKAGTSRKTGDSPFAYAQGKSWKTIRETFHQELIRYHSGKYQRGKHLARHLQMPATTLYSLKTRLSQRGLDLDPPAPDTEKHPLHSFIETHEALSWTEINQIFEREMIHYLYEKYGYNKLRMSKVLKLSYAIIIEKTRELRPGLQLSGFLRPSGHLSGCCVSRKINLSRARQFETLNCNNSDPSVYTYSRRGFETK